MSLGGAGVALGYDPALIWLNPAASSNLRSTYVSLVAQKGLFDEVTGQGLFATPVAKGFISIGGAYYDVGRVTLIASDDTVRSVSAQRDMMGIISYSGQLSPRMTGGVSVKGLQSEIAEEFRTGGMAFDLGFQWRLMDIFRAGVVVKNFGVNLNYLEDEVALPARVHAGMALLWRLGSYSPFDIETNNFLVSVVDAEFQINGGPTHLQGGLEYHLHRIIVFRVGGRLGPNKSLGNLSAGLGFTLSKERGGKLKQYRLDYSIRMLTSVFAPPQALSLTIAF